MRAHRAIQNPNESLNFISALHDYVLCGVLCADAQGKLFTISPDAEKILAKECGRAPARLPAPLLALGREAIAAGQPLFNRHLVLDPNKTSLIYANVIPVPPDHNILIVSLRDLSLAATLEQNLRRLDRLASAGTLAASMAHEIKNALVAVRTFVDLLLEKNPDAELAETVRREMERMDSVIGQMLKFAAPAPPAFSSVRLHQVLEYALRLARHREDNKVISFQREFNAASDALRGDDRQLEQAFVNLFSNAIEAIGEEGALAVSTDLISGEGSASMELREGGSQKVLRVKIADTGIGIARENLFRIFEPFFTTKPNGTGLGLAVTRRIVEEHRGEIRVESRHGKGTTFTILLPVS